VQSLHLIVVHSKSSLVGARANYPGSIMIFGDAHCFSLDICRQIIMKPLVSYNRPAAVFSTVTQLSFSYRYPGLVSGNSIAIALAFHLCLPEPRCRQLAVFIQKVCQTQAGLTANGTRHCLALMTLRAGLQAGIHKPRGHQGISRGGSS
jgi:hypothetical protein